MKQLKITVEKLKEYQESQENEGDTEALRFRLPRLEIPDWICSKKKRCVTTAEGTSDQKRWNIEECDVEAEIVAVSYGIKYGTPTRMNNGTCEENYPNDYDPI